MAISCPACNEDLDTDVDSLEEGDVIDCGECGAELEVVSDDPIELVVIDDEEIGH